MMKQRRFRRSRSSARVLVIGAGMSGLACARELSHRGYQVLIVEARARSGGRLKGGEIHTSQDAAADDRVRVDLGGMLIHGVDENPIATLAKDLGIPTQPVSETLLMDASGWPVDSRSDERVANAFNDCLEECFARVSLITQPREDGVVNSAAAAVPVTSAAAGLHKTTEQPAVEGNAAHIASASDRNEASSGADEQANQNADISQPQPAEPESPAGTESRSAQPPGTETQGGEQDFEQAAATSDVPDQQSSAAPPQPDSTKTQHREPNGRRSQEQMESQTQRQPTGPAPDLSSTFGDLFEQVCREKSVNTKSALLRWHRANLEVSCGATFDNLGLQWNEDEPYGYDGEHVALRHSWKVVVDALAKGLDILYNTPVKQIHVVPPSPEELQKARRKAEETAAPTSDYKLRSRIPKAQKKQPILVPTRQSRRLRGVDALARRSPRASLGTLTLPRFTVDHKLFSHAKRKRSKRVEKSPASGTEDAGANGNRQDDTSKGPKKTIVQVTLADGSVLEANHVVCTLPLSILKQSLDESLANKSSGKVGEEPEHTTGQASMPRNSSADDSSQSSSNGEAPSLENPPSPIIFDPPLPLEKQRAIRNLGCGLFNKCALSFKHVFWQDSDFLGLAGNPLSYLILNVHSYLGKPVLLFMFGASFAETMEGWSDAEVVQECLEVLRVIYHRSNVPEPIDYRVTRWGQEQYSQMAFTYVPPGVDGHVELQAMSEPVLDATGQTPSLMFAGEHTTPYHPSTIHGAYLTGIREAYRLDHALFPEESDEPEFRNNQIYERTFPVDRLYSDEESEPLKQSKDEDTAGLVSTAGLPPVENGSSGNAVGTRRKRRGRTARVMKLRKRATAKANDNRLSRSSSTNTLGSHKNGVAVGGASTPPHGSPAPTRKSQRSAALSKKQIAGFYAMPMYVDGDDGGVTAEDRLQLESVAVLEPPEQKFAATVTYDHAELEAQREERMLKRNVESFGAENVEFIEQVALPVYSDELKAHGKPEEKNGIRLQKLANLQKRCKQISQAASKAARSRSTSVWKQWIAKHVYPPSAPVGPPEEKAPADGKTEPEQQPRRRAKARVEKAANDTPEAVVSNDPTRRTTRSGRAVKRPRFIDEDDEDEY